jgi:cell division protein FtsQ
MRLAMLVLVLLLALVAGGWLWLRDSSLVSVDQVTVTGTAGPDAEQIRASLTDAGRRMTTLNVSVAALRRAVAPYPVVGDLRVSTEFPHRLRVRVIERIPIGIVTIGGRAMPVAGDNMLLHDVPASGSLPAISAGPAPAGPRVSDPTTRTEVALLAAAPARFISRLSQVASDATHGYTAQLRSGPIIYFGDGSRLAAKWTAAAAVLADQGSTGAAYIDVTDPDRPAAGVGQGQTGGSVTAASAGATGAATTATSSAAAAATSGAATTTASTTGP